MDKNAVGRYFGANRPDYVFFCAAKVGGILANSASPVEFFTDNVTIGVNVLWGAHKYDVKKLLNQ